MISDENCIACGVYWKDVMFLSDCYGCGHFYCDSCLPSHDDCEPAELDEEITSVENLTVPTVVNELDELERLQRCETMCNGCKGLCHE